MVEHFLWTALLQIDMIDQVKDLQEGCKEVRSIQADAQSVAAERAAGEPLSREDVYKELGCKKTTVWELEQLDLLHSFPVIGRGKCFDPDEVQRVKAMDPTEVSLMIKQQKAKRNALERAAKNKAQRERATAS